MRAKQFGRANMTSGKVDYCISKEIQYMCIDCHQGPQPDLLRNGMGTLAEQPSVNTGNMCSVQEKQVIVLTAEPP